MDARRKSSKAARVLLLSWALVASNATLDLRPAQLPHTTHRHAAHQQHA